MSGLKQNFDYTGPETIENSYNTVHSFNCRGVQRQIVYTYTHRERSDRMIQFTIWRENKHFKINLLIKKQNPTGRIISPFPGFQFEQQQFDM